MAYEIRLWICDDGLKTDDIGSQLAILRVGSWSFVELPGTFCTSYTHLRWNKKKTYYTIIWKRKEKLLLIYNRQIDHHTMLPEFHTRTLKFMDCPRWVCMGSKVIVLISEWYKQNRSEITLPHWKNKSFKLISEDITVCSTPSEIANIANSV
jgi:hypothetical protein